MNKRSMIGIIAAAAVIAWYRPAAAAMGTFVVDPDVGNNVFTAIFDAAIGERITAVSSGVGCTVSADEAAFEGRATCSVALTSIRVDNDDVKTEHFRQWATNKKGEPEACTLDLDVPLVKLPPAMKAKETTPFSTEGTFKICGRERDDHRPEHIQGTLTYLPPGAYGSADVRTLRIRARIERFDREKYGVGPKHTPGWLARVQQLADVVATEGTIDVSIFATSPVATGSEAKP